SVLRARGGMDALPHLLRGRELPPLAVDENRVRGVEPVVEGDDLVLHLEIDDEEPPPGLRSPRGVRIRATGRTNPEAHAPAAHPLPEGNRLLAAVAGDEEGKEPEGAEAREPEAGEDPSVPHRRDG